MKECEWLESLGARKANYQFENVDHKGEVHTVVPDLVLGVDNGETWIVEYKNGNCLTTDGARDGRIAAENKKERYINDTFSGAPYAKRKAYAEAKFGWNHSLYKMTSMNANFNETEFVCPDTGELISTGATRVMIVDKAMNRHVSKPENRKMFQKGKVNGLEFYTVAEFALLLDEQESPYQW